MGKGKLRFSTLSILLVFSMLFLSFPVYTSRADIDVDIEEEFGVETTFEAKGKYSGESIKRIAMVMDNSGSMYENGAKRWSQVKYAMEIFANMINDEDELYIYPMHNATVGEEGGTTYNQKNPLKITKDNIEDISNIYSVGRNGDLGGTPFSTVVAADKFLNSQKDKDFVENWLIVLADGEFTIPSAKKKGKYVYDTPRRDASKAVRQKDAEKEKEIKGMSQKVNVEYLIFNDEKSKSGNQTEVEEGNYHRTYAPDNSDAIVQHLITACNNIFQRDYFEEAKDGGNGIDGSNLNYDVSMRKIFVMAQTKDAEIDGIGNQEPAYTKKFATNDISRKFKDGKSPEEHGVKSDKDLGGVLAVFEDVKTQSGNSAKLMADNLDISDKNKCMITYEVDVDMNVKLENQRTKEVVSLPDSSLPEGKYKVTIGIYDQLTNKRVDKGPNKSDLIGRFDINHAYMQVGDKKMNLADGEIIEIDGFGEDGFLDVSGTYGNKIKYTIETMQDKDKWKFTTAKKIGLKLDRKDKYYTYSGIESGGGIIAHLTLNDKKLTDKELAETDVLVKSDKKLGYKTIPMKGKSAYKIKFLKKDAKGNNTEKGTHELKVKAVQKSTKSQSKVKKESITVTTLPIWVYWLIGIIILLLLLALAAFILTRKAGPKHINSDKSVEKYKYESGLDEYKPSSAGTVKYNPKTKRLDIMSAGKSDDPDSVINANFNLEPIKMRKDRRNKREMRITRLNLSNNVTTARIGGMKITQSDDMDEPKGTFYCGKKKLDEALASENSSYVIKNGTSINIDAITHSDGIVKYTTKLRFK